MPNITYFVALPFSRGDDGMVVAAEPKEARSADHAGRLARSLAIAEGNCGAVAFSRTGDPSVGEFADAVVLTTVGEVDMGLLAGA